MKEDTTAECNGRRSLNRLPRNMIDYFNAQFQDLEDLPKESFKLVLLSIVLASTHPYGGPLKSFEEKLQPYVALPGSFENVLVMPWVCGRIISWNSLSHVDKSKRLAELQLENPSWSCMSVGGKIVPHDRMFHGDYLATNHEGEPLSLETKDGEGGSDLPPLLTSKSLMILAHMHPPRLKKSKLSELAYEVDILAENQMEGMNVFPDDASMVSTHIHAKYNFLVLAASGGRVVDDEHNNSPSLQWYRSPIDPVRSLALVPTEQTACSRDRAQRP